MVHVTVGTANVSASVINASRARVPVIFSAGRTPVTEYGSPASRALYIHWAQESFDQAAMVREYVKWDYELRAPVQLETVVDRALALEYLAGSVPARELASRARVMAWDGAEALGPLKVSAWEDNFVATYKVRNYQMEKGVNCQ